MSSPKSDEKPGPPLAYDRRANRLEILPCEQCTKGPVKVTLRTE